MSKEQFDRADRIIERAAHMILVEIEKMFEHVAGLEAVAADYAGEQLMRRLADTLDSEVIARITIPGSATLRLGNALADYRDARAEER